MTSPRIYVASLSDYNAGILHGVWIDVSDTTADEINEQVQAMLASSPEFKRFPQGGPAEEWAIHDYEGFYDLKLSEWESFERVATIGQAIAEHGGAIAAWLANDSYNDAEGFEEHFQGEHSSFEAFVEEFVCEVGYDGLEGKFFEDHFNIIDFKGIARDFRCSGDFWCADAIDSHYVYVFSSN